MSAGSALQDTFRPLDEKLKPRILALGLGGAGNDLLTHMMDASLRGVYCIAGDTDRYHLQIARAHSKLLMEHASCSYGGTRGDVEVGRAVGLQACRRLRAAFDGADLIFVLAGMGGGTGGGAAPVISEAARKSGSIVVGLITRPFPFERQRLRAAIDSMRFMLSSCDTVIVVDNHPADPSSLMLPFRLNVDAAGQTCCSIVSSITEAFSNPSFLKGDAGELRSMLKRGGLAKAEASHSYSHCGVEEAALNALRKAVPAGYLSEATGVFLHIIGSENLSEVDVSSALDLVSRKINPGADILCARQVEANLQGTTQVSLLATGIPFPYTWGGYRKLPIEIFEMEPEAGEEERVSLNFGLDQIEAISV